MKKKVVWYDLAPLKVKTFSILYIFVPSGDDWIFVLCSYTVSCATACVLSLLRVDLFFQSPDVAFYPLYRRLESVDVFRQQLVGNTVFVDDIVVHASARRRRTDEETE